MEFWTSYRERMRRRPDSEHNQALLRVAIVVLLLINTAWTAARNPAVAVRLWTINLLAFAFSVAVFARIVQRPHGSPRRRVLGAIHDNVLTTIWLFISGPAGALGLFIYPFITVGNGFRFGVAYLAWSGLLGAIGIATLVISAPAWRAYEMIGAGVLLSHVVVTIYTGVLLRHLHQTRRQLEKMATYDALTGLPNRRFFMDQLARIVATRGDRRIACLYLDLDGFKSVNDRWGHRVGDLLLNAVATTLRSCIGATDAVARLGGDEFAVVLNDLSSPTEARVAAKRIIAAIEDIGSIDDQPVNVSVSIGISYIPSGELARPISSDELLKAADEAMYTAKRSARGRHHFTDVVTSETQRLAAL